jgi:beta-lactamase class A
VDIYRKSGSWRNFHTDGALVEAQGRRFIMIGIAEHPDGGEWLIRLVAPLHET